MKTWGHPIPMPRYEGIGVSNVAVVLSPLLLLFSTFWSVCVLYVSGEWL